MTFERLNLDPNISKALAACGYTIPTPVQSATIPSIMEGRDIVASAQTGTGKTAAFVLPALHRLSLKKSTGKPRVLILTPTRELATQVMTAAAKYGKFLNFNIINLVGGMPYRQQLRDLARTVDIIVATPGRLLDHMDNKRLDLSAVEMLVLDEADRMLDMGFIDDVKEIAKAIPANRQTLLFSATVDNNLAPIIRLLLKNPVRVDLSEEKMAPALIKQELYIVDNAQHKTRVLLHFMQNENIYKGIIFCATKIHCDQLAKQLRDQGFEAAALHGDLKQMVRNKTIERFRRGNIQFLIATDVAARGIDINDVTYVINYDLPKFAEDYVHRIGRTGRAGKTGIAVSLVMPSDTKHLQRIERFIKQKLEFLVIEGLEPTKKMGKGDTNTGAKKSRHGKSSNKFAPGNKPRGSYAKNFSEKKKSYASNREDSASFRSRSTAKSSSGATRSEFGGGRREQGGFAPKKKSYTGDRSEESTGGGRAREASRGNFGERGEARSFAGKQKSFGGSSRSRHEDDYVPKKKSFGDSSRAHKDDYAPKKKSFGDSSRSHRDDYAPKKKSFGDSSRSHKDDYAPKKKSFGDSSRSHKDDYAPKKKSFGDSSRSHNDDYAPKKKSFGDSSRSHKDDYAPKKKSFGDNSRSHKDDYAPRKKSFGDSNRFERPAGGGKFRGDNREEGFASKKKTFGSSRFDDAPKGRRARGNAPREEGLPPKKTFGSNRFEESGNRPRGQDFKKPAGKFGKPAKNSERYTDKPERSRANTAADNPKVSYGKSKKPFGRKTTGDKPFAKKRRERS